MISIFPPPKNSHRVVLVLVIACLLSTFAGAILVTAQKDDVQPAAPSTEQETVNKTRVAQNFGKLPLSFEINKGQVDKSVKFLAHGDGYDLFLTSTEAVLKVQKARVAKSDKETQGKTSDNADVREGTILRLKMLGASATPKAEGQDELPGKVNYFIGNDPTNWHRNIPTYKKAYFKNVYPGIDVVYYGKQRELEYDFIIAPGANPKLIRFTVEGAEQTSLDKTGGLRLSLKHGEVSLNKPVIYQLDQNGSRREIKGRYVISGNEVRFKLEQFDSTKPLIIDPVLSYSTLLGAGSNETALSIAVDSQGSAYVTGNTDGTTFPTTSGAFKTTSTTNGAFVTKLNPTGSALVYSTYLSGEGTTNGLGIAVDSAGNAHVTGTTSAIDFPIVNGLKTASNFYKTTNAAANWSNQNSGIAGGVNAIAVAPSAPTTIYASSSTGIFRSTDGGATWTKTPATGLSGFNFASVMAVDPTNAATVYMGNLFGLFKSVNGADNWTPVSQAPLGAPSVFSVVFDPSTPATLYVGTASGVFKSTDSGNTWIAQNNFGIPGTPNIRALAIDPSTPLTIYAGTFGNGLFKSINGGGIWTAMNNGMGGGNPTIVSAIAIDPVTPATVYTGHGNSPANGGINKSTNGGASWTPLTTDVPNAGIVAMAATSSGIYAVVNSAGIIKTTNGGTSWTNTATGLWSTTVLSLTPHPTDASILYTGTFGSGLSDAFVTKLNSSGSGILFSTFLGGSREESGNSIAVDPSGNILVAGQTTSSNFPFVNAVRSIVTFNGNCTTGFVTKINPAVPSYTFSTYLGGGNCDVANSVDWDVSGNVYVTGRTSSTDFPTANAFQPNLAGQSGSDAFVTKLTPAGALVFSTYLGGPGNETGFGIVTDLSGNAHVAGSTTSQDFPTFGWSGFPPNTLGHGFVSKFRSDGSGFVYSRYLGGSGSDTIRGITVDSDSNVYVTGSTDSIDFPVHADAIRTRSVIFKSTDGAANWNNDNYGFSGVVSAFSGSPVITGFALNPNEPSTAYAGSAVGVFKTTRGGRTWDPSSNGLPQNRGISAIVINPSNPAILYVLISDLTSASGVYKTTDGGDTWTKRSVGLVGTELHSLVIDPVTPDTLYVGVGCCVAGSKVFKTTDGADNWAPVPNAPPQVASVMAIDPLDHLTIYVADAATPGTVYKSTNAGTSWQPVGSALTFARSIAISPHTAGVVYAGTDQGILKSTDGGASWSMLIAKPGKIVLDPVSSSTLYLLANPFSTNSEGLLKSTNNGQTWIPMNKGLNTPQVVALAINPQRPSTLYLASMPVNGQDAFVTKMDPNGADLYSTYLGGPVTPESFFSNFPAQGFAIAVDSSSNAYVVGSTSTQFLVTPGSYQPFNRGANDAFIAKIGVSHLIQGRVTNGFTPINGAEVVLNDGVSLTSFVTENDGSYRFARLRPGGNYTVSASAPHFTMTPTSKTFNNLTGNEILNFSAQPSDSEFFHISGQITENGVGLSGVTVSLGGSQSGLRTTDLNGNFSFELIINGNYTITPSLLGFNFGPSITFNNLTANQTANFSATRQNFIVTNANNHGTGSLRDAIINANATLGADTIVFNIPGTGVKTINLLTALPEITDPVVIDAATQPGYAGTPLIEIDGTTLGSSGQGLIIKAGNSTVRGLSIGNFRAGNAIFLNACNNNTIQGNYLGVAANGTTSRPNSRGISLSNSSNNVIGGTTAATRNVIAGNTGSGIDINGNANVIQGNYIGTNAAGTAAMGNVSGVTINNPSSADNLIGGTASGAGNLISGNLNNGVVTSGGGTTIQGNLIGTDVTGTNKIPNLTSGVQAIGTNILVGGLTVGARNVISGNQADGVYSRGAGNKVQGNYIGTNIAGSAALGNSGNGVVAGEGALVGGTVPEARNIIAANSSFGNVALGQNNSGSTATVQGNYIGTDVTGTRALGGSTGINILSANNVIGGTADGARNVISGNSVGIHMGGITNGPIGNLIQGNFIGLNAAGNGAVPNTSHGISIIEGVNNLIGGTASGAGNKIAFNGGAGVTISNSNGTANAIRANFIFSNGGLGIDLGGNGVTANDGNDGDTGPNHLQNFPVISGVMSTSNSTTIQGSFKSIPSTTFQIDFFSNSAVDPSGNGEGAQFFGTTSVNTNGNGDATINVTIPTGLAAGRVITATATDPNGNTSEFSAADATATAGSVHFSAGAMRAIEDVGTLTMTVLRSGGSAGNLTVEYATVDGTATAGQDYTSSTGTLTFTGTETSKTIQVPILNDTTTELDETFTVVLRNPANLEAVGAPAVVVVTLQDRLTAPSLSILNTSVTEGNAGTTTDALFTLNLSAATGRTVSANYITQNINAFGGPVCVPGVDFQTASGSLSFNPGTTSITLPIKVCGDNSAEINENFRVILSNPVGASLSVNQAFAAIVDDDALELLLEESAPVPTQAAALDAILAVRDPFRVVGIPEWVSSGVDKNTRVVLFARGLQLNPGEQSSAVVVRFTGSLGQIFEQSAEDVRPIANTEFTQVIVRLPNNLPSGTCTIFIRAHSRESNTGTITIAP